MLCWQNIVITHRVKHETRECVLLFCRLIPIKFNDKKDVKYERRETDVALVIETIFNTNT